MPPERRPVSANARTLSAPHYRYTPGADGLPGKEGAFLPCSFWLLEALLRLGRREEGLRLFEQVLGLANDLLLLPEAVDPATGAYLGNYPLALSQAGLVHAVIEVQKVLESKPADGVNTTDHPRGIGNPTAPRTMV
jgi:GH15 family glucan-1,4-alpha-glucosidase